MDAAFMEDVGFSLVKKRSKSVTKDPNPEWFWAEYDTIINVTKIKSRNPKWGPKKISEQINLQEKKTKNILEAYFYDDDNSLLFRRSMDNTTIHRRCLRKQELIRVILENHLIDHRRPDTIYESLRRMYFPAVRETIHTLFKTQVECHQCKCATEIPKTVRSRRPIPATYPNSRWQIDLKKMPTCRGKTYVLNVVDCYSRFGFGKALKNKSAKEVADGIIEFIYLYGAPRILQSDNGREFKNSDLEEVVKEFETVQMHGRPYHPQSQGRVERFNRTMTDYFRKKMVDDSDWVGQLPQFYYHYNNRVHKTTRPSTPYQLFFKRPNFGAPMNEQVPFSSLTAEEKKFLTSAHLDVEEETDSDSDQSSLESDDECDTTLIAEKETPELLNEHQARNGISGIIEDRDEEVAHHSHSQITASERQKTSQEGSPSSGGSGDWSPLSMPTLSPVMHIRSTTETIIVQSTSEESPIPDPFSQHFPSPKPFVFAPNVSEYYRQSYRRHFGDHCGRGTNEPEQKRQRQTSVEVRNLHSMMYPLEQFSQSLKEDVSFYPNVGEHLYYRLNPALAAGTSYFKSGFFRPGRCVGFRQTNAGKIYTITDAEDGSVHEVNRYQLKQA